MAENTYRIKVRIFRGDRRPFLNEGFMRNACCNQQKFAIA